MADLNVTMLATARRLLRTYGQNITFGRVVEGAFVPTTGAVGAGTTTSYTAYGAPFTSSVVATTGNKEVANDTLAQNDLQVYLEVNAAGTVPLIGDTATLFGKVYRVFSISPYAIQGVRVLYKIQLRI